MAVPQMPRKWKLRGSDFINVLYPENALFASGTEAPNPNHQSPENNQSSISRPYARCSASRLVIGAWRLQLGDSAGEGQRSLLFEHLNRVPSVVRRLLFVLERVLEIHLGQLIVRIKFEKAGKQDFGFSKIALAEFHQSFFITVEPFQQLGVERVLILRPEERHHIHRQSFAFHLNSGDGAEMEFIAH